MRCPRITHWPPSGLLAPLALALTLSACAGGGGVPHPTPVQVSRAQTRWPGATRESLERGRDLYVARCSGCHPLHRPAEFPASRWPALLAKMAPRARLTPAERDLVLAYLSTVSGR